MAEDEPGAAGPPRKPPANSLLSIGECMVEMAPDGAGAYVMGFAGDTLNFAWYARARLGPDWRVGYLTAVGEDALSDKLLAFMAEAGIDTGAVARRSDRTLGLYLIHLVDGERSFSYWRGQSAARTLAADPGALGRTLAGAGVLYVSGITAAILERDTRDAFHSAIEDARAAGTLVVFDPNLRPDLWPDAETMRAGLMRAAAQADIVLPSFEDEAAAFDDREPAATAARYREQGASMVVITDGPRPVHVHDSRAERFTVAPPPVAEVRDTTAAGDSFNAGFLAELLGGGDVREAVLAGVELSARVIQRPGALV